MSGLEIASGIMAIGSGMKIVGDLNTANSQAKQLEANAQYTANQLKQNAIAAEAASQRRAIESRRQANLASSKALAVAAASGGGASDPTVQNIIGDIEQRGEYNSMMDLYSGSEKARGYRDQATATLMDAAAKASELKSSAKSKAIFGGITTLASLGANIYGAMPGDAVNSSSAAINSASLDGMNAVNNAYSYPSVLRVDGLDSTTMLGKYADKPFSNINWGL